MVLTKELAIRLEQAEIDVLLSRLTAIKEIAGNPMGVEIETFGHAIAFSVKNIPGPSFNTVKGLREGDEKYIEDIIEFYKQKETPVRVELTPAHVTPSLLAHLCEAGFYQTDFHTTLYAPHEKFKIKELPHPHLSVRLLEGYEFETFADLYTKGFQMPSFLKNGVAQNNEVLYNNPHWAFYLASIENESAGIGVMFTKNKIATLAAAATVPHLRNKGVQSALIAQRMNQASSEKCEYVVGQAKFGSISQNNLERAGLKIAYTKSILIKK